MGSFPTHPLERERDLDSPFPSRPHSLFFTASGAEVATSGPARLGGAPDAQVWQCCKENWLEPGQYLQTLIHTKPREAPQLRNPSKPQRSQDFFHSSPCPAMIMCVPLSLGNDTAKGRYSITASYTSTNLHRVYHPELEQAEKHSLD